MLPGDVHSMTHRLSDGAHSRDSPKGELLEGAKNEATGDGFQCRAIAEAGLTEVTSRVVSLLLDRTKQPIDVSSSWITLHMGCFAFLSGVPVHEAFLNLFLLVTLEDSLQ